MNMSVRERIALLLKDGRRRMQALGILVILALAVSINVGLVLRRRGLAKTQEVRVLDCPFSGVAAHTHGLRTHRPHQLGKVLPNVASAHHQHRGAHQRGHTALVVPASLQLVVAV